MQCSSELPHSYNDVMVGETCSGTQVIKVAKKDAASRNNVAGKVEFANQGQQLTLAAFLTGRPQLKLCKQLFELTIW